MTTPSQAKQSQAKQSEAPLKLRIDSSTEEIQLYIVGLNTKYKIDNPDIKPKKKYEIIYQKNTDSIMDSVEFWETTILMCIIMYNLYKTKKETDELKKRKKTLVFTYNETIKILAESYHK